MARKKARLDDFGDESFRLPLGKLLDSFKKKYGDTDANRTFSFAYILSEILSKRLYIEDNFKSNPGISEIPIIRPLFITGLPRTGTTLMHNLFSQGCCWRVFRYWELLYPYNIPALGNKNEEYFLRLTEQLIEGLYARYPKLISRHATKAKGPEECVHLLRTTFYSNSFAAEWDLYDYLKWYVEQDLTGAYRYYKKLMQLLLWREQGQHLLLKCPAHLFAVDIILKVFPDAAVIWMHRDPCKSIASVLSLYSVFREEETRFNDFIDLYLDYFKKSLQNIMKIVKSGNKQVKSISYKKLVKNQAEVTREIYEEYGYPYEGEIEKKISAWLSRNPQHKHGVHKYGLEDFGLTASDIKSRFAEYYDVYGDLL
jgi:hypothetical protein